MVNVSRKHDVVEEAPEAAPRSRVITRKPVSWAEAMMRIRQAIDALPRESEFAYRPDESGWGVERDTAAPEDELESPPPSTQRSADLASK